MALVALLAERRDARGLEQLDEPGELELVGDRERDDREIAERAQRPRR